MDENSPLINGIQAPILDSSPSTAVNTHPEDETQLHDTGNMELSLWQVLPMVPGLALGIMLQAGDSTLEYAAFPDIGSAFGQFGHVGWLNISYSLTSMYAMLIYSRLSDLYGRKPLLLLSYLLFSLGIAICCITTNFWGLVIARGIVGLGAAGMSFLVAVIFNDIIPFRKRALWQGLQQWAAFIGQMTGGSLGGLLVDRIGWRWSFGLEIPLTLITFGAVLFTLRLPKLFTQKATPRLRSSQSIDEEELSDSKINHFDLLGSLILFTFIACLVLGFGIAGNDVPWSHPAVLTLLPASLIFFIIFIYYELRLASFPLVPIEVFKKQAIWSLFLTTFCLDFAVMTVIYLIPLHIKLSRAAALTSTAGAYLSVFFLGVATGQMLAGILINWSGGRPWNLLVLPGAINIVVLLLIRSRWKGTESTSEGIIETLISGLLFGIVGCTLLISLLHSCTKTTQATIYGAFHIAIMTSSIIAVAVISSMIQYRSVAYLYANLRGKYNGDLPELVASCRRSLTCFDDLSPEVERIVRHSFNQAVRDSFGLATLITGLSCLFALLSDRFRI